MDKQQREEIKTAIAHLKGALTLIKAGWCQNTPARDANGVCAYIYSKQAVKFCAAGAITRIAGSYHHRSEALNALHHFLIKKRRIYGIVNFNDKPGQTAKRVALAFEGTIKELQAKLRKAPPVRLQPAPGRSRRSPASR